MNDKNYHSVIEHFSKLSFVKETFRKLNSSDQEISISTLAGSMSAATVAALWTIQKRKFIVVCSSAKEAQDWYNDINIFAGEKNTALIIKPSKKRQTLDPNAAENLGWMVDGLNKLSEINAIAIITADVLKQKLPLPDLIDTHKEIIIKGQLLEYEEFVKRLSLNGYERKDYVEAPGDISVRGGIVDVFPVEWDNPIRIEFWGDEVESIREFDTLSQRSIFDHEEISFIASIFYQSNTDSSGTIYDYADKNTVFVIVSPDLIESESGEKLVVNGFKKLIINGLNKPDIKVKTEPQPEFKGSTKQFIQNLSIFFKTRAKVALCAGSEIHLERFRDIVVNAFEQKADDENIDSELKDSSRNHIDSVTWLDRTISKGFFLPDQNFAFFTEHELFGRIRIKSRKKGASAGGLSLRKLRQLQIGDYIVHDDKGIGIFDGFETVELGGSYQDCVRILYEGGDILYVHLNYLHKVQQYTSQEGAAPKVNKLGSADWGRKKARTKKKLKDIARDLIKLYANRKMEKGFAFPSDTIWQKEFEASFIYEDTPDQASSTSDLKKDMESATPMDRLVCGDVGFGKTEIAIRATFKAVLAGKQVAVLVPTTILSQQHYMTFRDRLNQYPVITEVISRFRKKSTQSQILERIKNGGSDILIGTHRLLSKDVEFKDLGLLIIDEEQRFGVGAKEKLRKMKVAVDTLTLTATPIPRTLNFSLMGARDLSIIATPPRNRIPVYTDVIEWSNDLIVDAIEREINRNGQVFFVNDKIENIDKLQSDLQMLMPELKFAVAHGQMKSTLLESVMEKFIKKKIDVLISTKIVESGLDIPNANTMIINSAHRFGLAELYQLRGRVGRTNVQAYCYLLIPPISKISTKAVQKLQAIEEFTDLGSGFQLALRDLEIRGAGDLLGPEQSGFINEIGFELYHKILDEAVSELRVEEFSDIYKDVEIPKTTMFENEDLAIELDSDALIPSSYIESDTERFMFYKKLYKLKSHSGLNESIEELKDRYGKLPKETKELAYAVKVRIAAMATGFTRIIIKPGILKAEFPHPKNKEYYAVAFPLISEFMEDLDNAILKQTREKLFMEVPISGRDEAVEILWRIKKTLENLE